MKKRLISALLTAAMVAVPFASVAEATSGATTIAGTPREETLVVEGLDGVISNPGQSKIPDLAAKMPEALNDDYTSFKITLTEGIKWSDGEDFDAEDVVFTINELIRLKDQIGYGNTLANMVESVEYVDKYELIVNTVDARPRLSEDWGVTVWGNGFRVIPEHYWSEHDLTTDPWEDPIGTGPYKLSESGAEICSVYCLWNRRKENHGNDEQ